MTKEQESQFKKMFEGELEKAHILGLSQGGKVVAKMVVDMLSQKKSKAEIKKTMGTFVLYDDIKNKEEVK